MREITKQRFFLGRKLFRASFTVFPQDRFNPQSRLRGNLKVILEQDQKQGIPNLSGYYNFTDMPDRSYTVCIESEFYHRKKFTVHLDRDSSPPPSNSPPCAGVVDQSDKDLECRIYKGVVVITVHLQPKPNYPFPSATSLIRGMVFDKNNNPLPAAKVQVVGSELENLTTEKGEYVLFFTNLKYDPENPKNSDIIVVDDQNDPDFGKRFVKGPADNSPPFSRAIRLRAVSDSSPLDISPEVLLAGLEEGTTASKDIFYS